jgi:hypothetical protein
MVETLLLYACLSGPGCPETSAAYYQYNGAFRERAEYWEYRVKYEVGDTAFLYTSAIVNAYTHKRYIAKISKNMSMEGDILCTKLSLLYSYQF